MVGRYERQRQIAAEIERRRNPQGLKLISMNDAASWGIERLRQPNWANPFDHFKIDIINGELGPWAHLYCPFNLECNGRDPVDVLIIEHDPRELAYVPYAGPIAGSPEYLAEQATFTGVLNPAESSAEVAASQKRAPARETPDEPNPPTRGIVKP